MNAAMYFTMRKPVYANATGRLYRLVEEARHGREAICLELMAYSREFSPAGPGLQLFVRGEVVTFTQVPKGKKGKEAKPPYYSLEGGYLFQSTQKR